MFSNIVSKLENRMDRNINHVMTSVRNMTCGDVLSTRANRDLLTPEAFRIVNSKEVTDKLPEVVVRKIRARVSKRERNEMNNAMMKLDAAWSAEVPQDISIHVEWVKNGVYGLNPRATVFAGSFSSTGRASGCGYDKESAAVANALNRNASVMKIWCEHADNGGSFPYSMYCNDDTPVPSMDGGCGMSSVRNVFESLGYSWSESHGKSFDYYRAELKG